MVSVDVPLVASLAQPNARKPIEPFATSTSNTNNALILETVYCSLITIHNWSTITIYMLRVCVCVCVRAGVRVCQEEGRVEGRDQCTLVISAMPVVLCGKDLTRQLSRVVMCAVSGDMGEGERERTLLSTGDIH